MNNIDLNCGVEVIVEAINNNSQNKTNRDEIFSRFYIDESGITIETMLNILTEIGFNIKLYDNYTHDDNAIYLLSDEHQNHYIYKKGNKIYDSQKTYEKDNFYKKVMYTIVIFPSNLKKFSKRKSLTNIFSKDFISTTLVLTVSSFSISFLSVYLTWIFFDFEYLIILMSLISLFIYFFIYEFIFHIASKREMTKLFKWISNNLVKTNAAEFYKRRSLSDDFNDIKSIVKNKERKLNDSVYIAGMIVFSWVILPSTREEIFTILSSIVILIILFNVVKYIDFRNQWITLILIVLLVFTNALSIKLISDKLSLGSYITSELVIFSIVLTHIIFLKTPDNIDQLERAYFFKSYDEVILSETIYSINFNDFSFQNNSNLTKKINMKINENSVMYFNSILDIENINKFFSGNLNWYNGKVTFNMTDSKFMSKGFYIKNFKIINSDYKENAKSYLPSKENLEEYSEYNLKQKNLMNNISTRANERFIIISIDFQCSDAFLGKIDSIITTNFTNSIVVITTNIREIFQYDWNFLKS